MSEAAAPGAAGAISVAITGAGGNIGRKLIAAFLKTDWCREILAIDHQPLPAELANERVLPVVADLTQRDDERWRDAIVRADAVVHLAARNPYPDASWSEVAASVDMTINVVEAAVVPDKPRRLVFASSNHVMGGYKDRPEAQVPASLQPDTPPLVGTVWAGDGARLDSTPYATAKLMGERLLMMRSTRGGLTSVALRIGWCQQGENHPMTISASGTPKEGRAALDEAGTRDLCWFRNMWLSNGDMVGIVAAALRADDAAWPGPAVIVNATSANRNSPWDLAPARDWLGYVPKDDAWSVLARA